MFRFLRHTALQKCLPGSLGAKFVFLTVIVLSATLGFTAIVNYDTQNKLYLDNLKNKGKTLGEVLAEISAEPILSYDYVSLNEFVRNVSRSEDIVYVVIMSTNGNNITSYLNLNNHFFAQALEVSQSDNVLELVQEVEKNSSVMPLNFPITFGKRRLGSIRMGMNLERIDLQSSRELKRQLLGNAFIIIFLSTCIYIVFRYNSLRPIVSLMKGAKRIARGDLDTEVEVRSNDELGRLTRSFNAMMRDLKESVSVKDGALKQLQELNQSLESRVEERTRQLEHVNRELEHIALHDALTSLPNRSLIQDRLQQWVFEADRDGAEFSVLMLDLDRFKEVNDTLGHECGDMLLIEIAKRLKSVLREGDTFGRLGGDEFAFILPHTGIDAAVTVVGKILKSIEPAFSLEKMKFSISGSIGVAVYPEHGTTPSSLLKAADVAMYMAKNNKQGYCIYHERIDSNNPERLSLMGELRTAIKHDELKLFYQPKINIKTRKIVGVEALVRWFTPDDRLIPPDQFIPLAEHTGLIRPLTRWVLNKAFEDSARWESLGLDLPIAINLSMYNLQDHTLPEQIRRLMNAWNVEKRHIMFEITESAIMRDPEHTMVILEKLEEMGAKMSIDDFGTGYSSLSNLKKLPVHELKIDRSFVMDMANDRDDAAIVRSVIDLAHNLGLQVIAEGVEDVQTLNLLEMLGCNLAQGYYISKPVPEEELLALINSRDASEPAKVDGQAGKGGKRKYQAG